MSDSKLLLLGVLAIFIGAGAMTIKGALDREYEEKKVVCYRTCLPYYGEPASKGKCLCDMFKTPDGEDERP